MDNDFEDGTNGLTPADDMVVEPQRRSRKQGSPSHVHRRKRRSIS